MGHPSFSRVLKGRTFRCAVRPPVLYQGTASAVPTSALPPNHSTIQRVPHPSIGCSGGAFHGVRHLHRRDDFRASPAHPLDFHQTNMNRAATKSPTRATEARMGHPPVCYVNANSDALGWATRRTDYNQQRPTVAWGIARRVSSQCGRRRQAMEKTRTASAWKTPLAFPTFPQLRLLAKL